MRVELYVQPETVCFSGIVVEEVPSTNGTHQGYFANVHFEDEWYHTTEMHAGNWLRVENDNHCGRDEAMMGDPLPRELPDGTMTWQLNVGTWSDGLIVWDIPWGWTTNGCEAAASPIKEIVQHYNQTFEITEDGTLTITKFGNTVSRGTNNVFRLNSVIVDGYPNLEDYSDD